MMCRIVFALASAAAASVLLGSVVNAQEPIDAPRTIPARSLPVPATVSPRMQHLIGQQPNPATAPQDAAAWKVLVATAAKLDVQRIAEVRKQFDVAVEQRVIGGVNCFIVIPKKLPRRNRDRLLVHVHGGGYVFAPGEAAPLEAIIMAGFAHMKVISIDYRMPPDFPYPAAIDDAMAVWREAVKMAKPANMAIFGTSTGGALTLSMVQRAKEEGLPLPGAIAPGTPWSDLSKTGDSYFTNEFVDNGLYAYEPLLSASALLYAGGHDLKDPHLSPVYGDFHGFPPTILTTGTRDLFLSNTVRVHRKLREAGVVAELEVYEGQSHGQYLADTTTPESKEAFDEIVAFFDAHLGH